MAITASKLVRSGTHRVRPLEETWDIVRPYAREIGVTRVSNVTWLDEFGIPVWQAIRPLGRSLSVAQGKGVTDLAAKVSAVMEAIECHHAEHIHLDTQLASVEEISKIAGYDPMEFTVVDSTLMHPSTVLEWIPATFLSSGQTTWVPKRAVDLDMSRGDYNPPLLQLSTTGLASGNSLAEALCHAIYEAVERDATTLDWLAARQRRERVRTDGSAVVSALARRIEDRGAELQVFQLGSRVGIPVFAATVWSQSFPLQCAGFGCHFDPEVALCRAITEAAQSRVTVIAGARDDVRLHWMDALAAAGSEDTAPPSDFVADAVSSDYEFSPDIENDLHRLVTMVESTTSRPVIAVDLSAAGAGFSVVRVLCPGLSDRRDSHA